MKASVLQIFTIALLLSLMGCAATDTTADENIPRIDTAGMQKGCFYVREVNDWAALTELNILVYAPTKSRPYLITLSRPVRFLENDRGLLLEGDAGRICGRVGDQVIIREGVARSVPIIDVRKLDDAEGKQLIEQKEAGALPLITGAADSNERS